MSQNHCPRTWEADALEDDQLAGNDRASFERHTLTCSTCRHEVEELARLRAIMRRVEEPEATPLEQRRARISLLDRASRARRSSTDATGTGYEPRRWHAAFAAAALVACLVAIGGVWTLLHTTGSASAPSVAAHSAAPPTFDVADVDSADWTRLVEGGVARPSLKDGVAAFHVEPMGTGQRFLLGLPDGELEVRGTRFVVEVHDGRTDSVRVTEGVVALRIRGEDERLLRAGDRWSRVTEPRATAPRVTANDEPREHGARAESSALPVRPTATATTRATASAPTSVARDPMPVAPAAARSVASERFAAAAQAFRGRDYAQADSMLASFTQDFPSDPRAEDAAFLRAVARSRSGDRGGAAALARAYLRGYPHGLRRREAEQLIIDGAASSAPDGERLR